MTITIEIQERLFDYNLEEVTGKQPVEYTIDLRLC